MRISIILRSLPRLTLYTGGPECSLCEVAKEALAELHKSTEIDFVLETVNIREKISDPAVKTARRLWQYDIPVLLLDGRFVMKHKVDPVKLEKLVKDASSSDAQDMRESPHFHRT